MNILVLGGSGYIGKSTIGRLLELGHKVRNIDLNHVEFTHDDYFFEHQDLKKDCLISPIDCEPYDACINFAAYKDIEESIKYPYMYYNNNVNIVIKSIQSCYRAGIKKYIFSSSASVYGDARGCADESTPVEPTDAYPNSKIIGEMIVNDMCSKFGMTGINLRYFNPVGFTKYSEDLSDSLFGTISNCLKNNKELVVFGDDYEGSKDGTCIRDFININDLVDAHIFALDKIDESGTFNVGTGVEVTIKEVAEAVKSFRPDFNYRIGPRRIGDTVGGYAGTKKLSDLGFKCRYSIKDTIKELTEHYK